MTFYGKLFNNFRISAIIVMVFLFLANVTSTCYQMHKNWSLMARYYQNQTTCYRDLTLALEKQAIAKQNGRILGFLRLIPTVRSLVPEALELIPMEVADKKAGFLERLPFYSTYLEMQKKDMAMKIAYRDYTNQRIRAERWNSWVSKFWIFGRPYLVDLPTWDELLIVNHH